MGRFRSLAPLAPLLRRHRKVLRISLLIALFDRDLPQVNLDVCLPRSSENVLFVIPVGVGFAFIVTPALGNLVGRHARGELTFHSLGNLLDRPEVKADTVWNLRAEADPPDDQLPG